ncbi:hypothetical protein BDA96_02G390600 [Sorghum bicolor]|uniref:Uncharacterized protein n=2 Tax=Sorghum bicolor TaxID=4558 RepID=A0A921UXU6_SORBI|nr:hypothetical protein BDA96_02G390600 [Sorghum bicolor]KXG36672.1 hypothetical protein SORBI_3002G372600 [Sorghum bicolor]
MYIELPFLRLEEVLLRHYLYQDWQPWWHPYSLYSI